MTIYRNKALPRAFSMVELSFVILILSLMVVAFFTTNNSKTNLNAGKLSNERIQSIRDAIKQFVLQNNRLPCPADAAEIQSSSLTYGAERTSNIIMGGCDLLTPIDGSDDIFYGMVPIKALGLADSAAEDGYGNKIMYAVRGLYTSKDDATGINYFGTLPSEDAGTPIIIDGIGNSDALFVVISAGPDGIGGIGPNSSTPSDPNINGGTGPVTNDFKTPDNSITPVAKPEVLSTPANGGCKGETATTSITYTSTRAIGAVLTQDYTWSDSKAGAKNVPSKTPCPCLAGYSWRTTTQFPTRHCNIDGTWSAIINNCTEGAAIVNECKCQAETITPTTWPLTTPGVNDIVVSGAACSTPAYLAGTPTRACKPDGKWDAVEDQCAAGASCPLTSGVVYYGSGDTAAKAATTKNLASGSTTNLICATGCGGTKTVTCDNGVKSYGGTNCRACKGCSSKSRFTYRPRKNSCQIDSVYLYMSYPSLGHGYDFIACVYNFMSSNAEWGCPVTKGYYTRANYNYKCRDGVVTASWSSVADYKCSSTTSTCTLGSNCTAGGGY